MTPDNLFVTQSVTYELSFVVRTLLNLNKSLQKDCFVARVVKKVGFRIGSTGGHFSSMCKEVFEN